MTPHPQAHILRAIADGHQIQISYTHNNNKPQVWYDLSEGTVMSQFKSTQYRFRIKPATIMIGDVEVNAPLRVAPDVGTECWCIASDGDVYSVHWINYQLSFDRLKRGLVFATEADATAARDAIVKLLGGEV